MHLVRVRSGAFSAQAEVAALVRRLSAGEVDLDGTEAELERIEQGEQPYAVVGRSSPPTIDRRSTCPSPMGP